MKTNDAGLALIKRFEGQRLVAYQDVAGVWTIGYGHIRGVTEGMTITAERAEGYLHDDLANVEEGLEFTLGRFHLNENEFSALASLVLNIGIRAVKPETTIFRALEKGDRSAAADGIKLWDKATVNGVKQSVAGLAARRAAERALFLTSVTHNVAV